MYGGQCHGRKFKVWRWEQQFVKFFGDDWKAAAVDQEVWNDQKQSWLSWRSKWAKF